MAEEPMVFISHKHSDRAIAETIARFMRTKSAGNLRVHLSSSPDFDGPRLGQPLNDELKRALAASHVVILVYTTEDEDWSYCMWECGLATDPADDTPTSVIVVQCATDEPKPFGDQLRVDARDLDSVKGFVKAFLTTTDFFPETTGPITGFSGDGPELQDFASELHSKLADVLPSGRGVERSTPTCPYLRVRLDDEPTEEARAAYLDGDKARCLEVIASHAFISENVGASNLFGMQLLPDSVLGDLLADWRREADDDAEALWFDSLAEQIEAALVGRLRPVKWAPYASVQGKADVPFVAASRQLAAGVEFDIYMVPIAPRPVLVKNRMLRIDQVFVIDIGERSPTEARLTELITDMDARQVSRLPILESGSAHAIVHKSTLNEIVARSALEGGDVSALTLENVLTDHADELSSTYVEVPPDATFEEAMDAMQGSPGCQDVYVMDGDRVVGWLTNVMFIQE